MELNDYPEGFHMEAGRVQALLALDPQAASIRFGELDKMAAYYREDVAQMLVAIRQMDATDLMEAVLLALLADQEVMAKILAVVRPPDSLF